MVEKKENRKSTKKVEEKDNKSTKKVEEKVEKKERFEELGLSDNILNAVKKKGFEFASEIQAKIIPKLLENKKDIIGVSHTGSGKTAAFALPIIDLIEEGNKKPKVIVLAPTRELAMQVSKEISSFKANKRLNIVTVYGGTPINNQIKDLRRGCDIVVGTPGRVLDLMDRRALILSEIDYFVLDEADEMLNMGFIEDIELIFNAMPETRRVLLFSATMPKKIITLTKKYMKTQEIVKVERKIESRTNIDQKYFIQKRDDKFGTLKNIIDMENFFFGIVFCKTKSDVDDVASKLKKAGFDADAIHGDIAQAKRERILKKFRDLKLNILIATDVAARGIDVPDLTHVINYSMPQDLETYIHRIGRVGRAGKHGISISFISGKERWMIRDLERMTESKIERLKDINEADVIKKKQEKLIEELNKIIEKEKNLPFIDLANTLIDSNEDGTALVSALLSKIITVEEKKESSSRDSRDSRDRDSRSKNKIDLDSDYTRLFVAKGKMDKFNNRELFNFLEKGSKTRIDGKDIKICEKFSFVTVPTEQAEKIVDAFTRNSKSRRPMVEVASNNWRDRDFR